MSIHNFKFVQYLNIFIFYKKSHLHCHVLNFCYAMLLIIFYTLEILMIKIKNNLKYDYFRVILSVFESESGCGVDALNWLTA